MNSGDYFLLTMSLGYVGAAIAYWLGGNPGYAIALTAYAVANIGLIAATK